MLCIAIKSGGRKSLSRIDEISIDLKGKRLTVIGTVDPVSVVTKLRKKNWPVHIISPEPEMMHMISTALPYRPYRPYHTPVTTYYPVHHSMEEDPNACIIS
ncbi:hypothetical protein SASPL_108248 [Salvia splendens]|uniref:Uncharacterized protein n=1 Tax=Salvia splendens TaxID=180675 RepID=A0A8X8YHW5_SALSN|nr:hypothetical protein SASPL_108248 [Salvia splendens]